MLINFINLFNLKLFFRNFNLLVNFLSTNLFILINLIKSNYFNIAFEAFLFIFIFFFINFHFIRLFLVIIITIYFIILNFLNF